MPIHDATSSDFIYEYDVFLSFRGETRYGFTGYLYSALCKNGIAAFIDEDLRIGDEIGPTLLETIENSRMSIIVLSENYASSSWCLDELLKIIQCYDNKGQQVLAIFYKVEQSDVRQQKNSYEAAMIMHESRFGHESEKVKAWRLALSRVCNLSREYCSDNTYESELIQKIVKETLAKLPPLPSEIKYMVGLDSRFEQVKSLMDVESNNTVCILEIYGAGGIGKTTFAKDFYVKIKHEFEAACFLDNVREKSNKSITGLENLQKKMLSEMGEETEIMIGSTFRGGFEIKRRLGHKKVLLVLDDVDSVNQWEALAGGGDWFGSGSRIIVTTRDTSVLGRHLLDDVIIKRYEMEVLNNDDSLELFCRHAFNVSRPAENFASICSRAVGYAKGFPLALKLLGSNLKGKSVEEWEKELEEYDKIINNEIQGVLERSYYSLFELDQKSFLDIACFFKGEKWEYVQRIIKACDFFSRIRVFVCKCLITIDENGCLEMHDLIQDMGREIVRRKSPLNPGDRCRLWSHEEILQVLEENSGSSTIEGIMLHPPKLEKVDRWNNTAFKKMKNLRILIVRGTIFSTGPNYLPNSLRLIDWKGYPSKSFPPNFHPQNVVDFKLPHSRLALKKSFQIFKDLTFINLSQCQSISQIPDVSGANNLRVLTLDGCQNLVRFDKSVGFLPKLVYLSATECNALKSFVPKIYLPSLEVLSFNFCSRLEHFPHVMEKMEKPLKIRMINTAVKEFPESIGNLTGLEHIDMSVCRGLKDLSSSFLLLPKLITLIFDGCSQLGGSFKRFKKRLPVGNGRPNLVTLYLSEANLSDEDLYIILENFPKLEDLNVSHNGFVSLPECIKGSLHLKILDVSYCRNLTEISGLPSSIQKVDARYCQSLTSEASSVLWSKVKEMKRIQVVMPKTPIPEWFDCVRNEDIPFFWARRKFPVVALAFMFGEVKEDKTEPFPIMEPDKSYTICLHLFIDGQEISLKDYHYFRVGKDHVLLCDLRALYDDKEWQDLDAACLGDDWKAVQVQCESPLILSRWGVYVYDQETDSDHIRFRLPHPNSSGEYMPPSHLVPKITRQRTEQEIRHAIVNTNPGQIFGNNMPLIELEEIPDLPKALVRSWRNAKADVRGEALASTYGASIKEESDWDVARLPNLAKMNKPWGQMIDDSVLGGSQSKRELFDQIMREQVDCMKKGKWGRWMDINMPIILEECHFDKAPTRRYWGNLEIEHGELEFNAVMMTKLRNQLACGEALKFMNEPFPGRANIVLLKCQHPSTEEASSSSHGESLGEEYHDPLVLELIMRTIEEDAMRLNKSYGKMKASIVLMDDPVSNEYKVEAAIIRMLQTWGMLGSNLKKTPYGRLRVEDNNRRLSWICYTCDWCMGICFSLLVGFIVSCICWCYNQI